MEGINTESYMTVDTTVDARIYFQGSNIDISDFQVAKLEELLLDAVVQA